MKNIVAIVTVLIICLISRQVFCQSVTSESAIKVSETETLLSVQRIEINNSIFTLKYDYKANNSDVLGIIIPKIWSNSTSNIGAMIVSNKDENSKDQLIFDVWSKKRFGKLATTLEVGRIVNFSRNSYNYFGTRLSYGNLSTEIYVMPKHSINGGLTKNTSYYAWLAFHPKHTFVALGKQDKQYWAYGGTKGLDHFGNFTLVNYQPETKNFWFKSQTAFGEINKNFFCQENYILAASYLTVPTFFYIHFSPIVTKGSLTLKVEGRRTGNVQNYEVMMGKQLDNDLFGFAIGINSECCKTSCNLAPSFELYKSWKNSMGQCIVELRYDHLYKALYAFLVIKY